MTPPEREPIVMDDNIHGMFSTGTKLELVAEPDGSHRWVDDHTQPSLEGGRMGIRQGNKPTRFRSRGETEALAERCGASCVVSVRPRIYSTANIGEPAEKVAVRNR